MGYRLSLNWLHPELRWSNRHSITSWGMRRRLISDTYPLSHELVQEGGARKANVLSVRYSLANPDLTDRSRCTRWSVRWIDCLWYLTYGRCRRIRRMALVIYH